VMQTNIRNNKFGQETLDNNDVRILLADEGAGTYNSDKHHSTSTSVGYVDSLKIRDNTFLTTATNHQPIIYSYTPHVYNLNFDNTFYGAYHPSIIGFANALVDDPESGYNRTSNFSYRQAFTGTSFPVPDASSSPGLGHVEDPHGYLEGRLQYPHFYPGAGTDPSYVRLLSRDVITSADWTLYQATKSDATDSVGGANATTVTFTNAGGMFHSFAQDSLLAAGRSGFVEFDVKASATNALTEFEVGLFSTAWTGVCTSRTLKVPNTWTRVRLPFVTRDATALFLRFTPRGYAAGKTSITIGRPAIYYAQEPVNLGTAPQVGLQVLTAVPTNPYAGMIVIADRATWDPKSKGSGGPYPVWYNGSVWKLLNEQ
jgi:hypothetical protein